MLKNTNDKGISVIFILLFIAIVLGGVVYIVGKNYVPLNNPSTTSNDLSLNQIDATLNPIPTPTPIPTPKPTIYPLIPDNGTAGTYQVSQPKHSGPTFGQVIFDPLDVKKDQNLKITVKVDSATGVQSLTGNFQMDSSQKSLTFKKIGNSGTIETWEVDFILPDSVSYKYILTLTGKDSQGTSTMAIAPRS
ncbi:MAG TPA: hypothetical protein VFI61_00260 [Patescibacteria group bacterium]|nr:hypothetical protein [Patescibacteria group bacterium]